jgi:hypothetical protein
MKRSFIATKEDSGRKAPGGERGKQSARRRAEPTEQDTLDVMSDDGVAWRVEQGERG